VDGDGEVGVGVGEVGVGMAEEGDGLGDGEGGVGVSTTPVMLKIPLMLEYDELPTT